MTGRGRPTRNTSPIHIMVHNQLLAELRTRHPELLKPASLDFKYGALAKFIESILWKELRSKAKHNVQSETLNRSMGGQGSEKTSEPRGDNSGPSVYNEGIISSRHSNSSWQLGDSERSVERVGEEDIYERDN